MADQEVEFSFGFIPATLQAYNVLFKDDFQPAAMDAHVERIQNLFRSRKNDPSLKISRFNIGSTRCYAALFDDETLEDIRNSPEVRLVVPNESATSKINNR